MSERIELPELLLPDVDAWREWLAEHHGQRDGVRLVLAKKGFTEPTTLRYQQALEEALCYGWIDGQVGRRDEATMYQRFTPRRARSVWSQRNVGLVGRLLEQGRMRPAGIAAVEAAKADGRWSAAYAGSATMTVPDDFAAALRLDPAAEAAFEGLTRQNRFSVLMRIGQAKRAETRARRISGFVQMLARGDTPYPQRSPRGTAAAKRQGSTDGSPEEE